MRELLGFILVATALGGPAAAATAEPSPPDLRLEWRDAGPVEGAPGATVELSYRIRNVGGRDAFALVLRIHTSLGPREKPERVQPGPKAGGAVERKVALPLATGMRQICVEAMLQTLTADDPGDSNTKDNRICRPVRVREAAAEGGER